MADVSTLELVSAVFTRERIDQSAVAASHRFYDRIAARIIEIHNERQGEPLVLGICGPQASGKSTMAMVLEEIFAKAGGLAVAQFSLDDLYLSSVRRAALARTIHPLLQTRGVPGTHDVGLGLSLIEGLRVAMPERESLIPVFDKATDNPLDITRWRKFQGRADIIIFEGWCVGARPQDAAAVDCALNDLERTEDATGIWRRYVNAQLAGPYQELFRTIGVVLFIRAPGFETVFDWRRQQESKLREALARGPLRPATARTMDDAELRRFISHYERLTRHILEEMPARADILLNLDKDGSMTSLTFGAT
jgi:D-glycerate 3-kinase